MPPLLRKARNNILGPRDRLGKEESIGHWEQKCLFRGLEACSGSLRWPNYPTRRVRDSRDVAHLSVAHTVTNGSGPAEARRHHVASRSNDYHETAAGAIWLQDVALQAGAHEQRRPRTRAGVRIRSGRRSTSASRLHGTTESLPSIPRFESVRPSRGIVRPADEVERAAAPFAAIAAVHRRAQFWCSTV